MWIQKSLVFLNLKYRVSLVIPVFLNSEILGFSDLGPEKPGFSGLEKPGYSVDLKVFQKNQIFLTKSEKKQVFGFTAEKLVFFLKTGEN